jgi:hypothetical protein
MRLLPLLFFCTISVLLNAQWTTLNKSNENPTSLYFGIDNVYYIEDSLLQNPFIKSKEADVLKKDNYFVINLKLPHRENIHLEICDIRKNDTILIRTITLPEKRIPDPSFSIEGKLTGDTISKRALIKAGKFDVILGDAWLDKIFSFNLISFDLIVQGKQFHSNSNNLTSSMIFWIKDSKSLTLRVGNDFALLKNGDNYPRLVYGDKTFYLVE